jgi:hypothetical protein
MKKGNMFIGIGMAIITFAAVIACIPILKQQIDIARNETYLNCSSTSLSVGTSATCIGVGWYLFGFVMVGLGAAVTYLVWGKQWFR